MAAFGPATLFGLAEGAMIPVIALSSIDRGASTAIAALINALLGIGSIVTNIPSGVLATRIGERKSMLVAAAVAVAGLVLCLVNLGRGALSLAVFGLGVLLLGAASSVYTLARQSYLTESVPPHLRARALSTLGGVLRIGMFVGPFLGAGAEELWGLPGAYYVSLAAMGGAAVIVLRVPDLEKTDQQRAAAAQVTTRGILREYWRTFLTLGLGVVLLSAIRQTRQVVIPLWAAHIGLSPRATLPVGWSQRPFEIKVLMFSHRPIDLSRRVGTAHGDRGLGGAAGRPRSPDQTWPISPAIPTACAPSAAARAMTAMIEEIT